ncbi:protein kinase domain-containing protein [Crateriforma spongiae]|uniref:protein kinase domain-containing protein n=1 Tax=Crateriforma spongiae TaxID=2724528 RepID=UPI001447BEA0|nr:protein kinase [Crateriforma spongiae]
MTTVSGNLLQTIIADQNLSDRLASMPADSKTVSLSFVATNPTFSHPAWQRTGDAADHTETHIMPEGAAANPSTDPFDIGQFIRSQAENNVPIRRVATLEQGKRHDAEYRLVGKLGSGGTGIVYQAHQRAIDREVAVKQLRDDLSRDTQSRERFVTEARVIGGLDHPNVIALHELCMDDQGRLFYSMKRVDGSSWDQQIADMSIEENLRVLLRVADAIRYAHSRGLVHRDIKPENVMLGRFGEVLLADWGLAISHGPTDRIDREIDSTIGGTPAYMAPELAMGDTSKVSFQTDVYLLGAVLFQILTGQAPHHGETLLACIHAAANNVIRPTDVEGELMDVAMQAMATRPADRHQGIEAFISAIEDYQVHRQSVSLVRRAEQILHDAQDNAPEQGKRSYEPYRLADAILNEAVQAWPGNKRAHRAQTELHRQFASIAASNGDLDLAISLYESCGDGESEVAMRLRRQRDLRNDQADREARYSALFTRSPEAGLLVRITDGEVLEANEAFLTLLGYDVSQIVGARMPELQIYKCPEKRREFFRRLQKSGKVDNFEAVFLRRDGSEIHVLISARSIELGDEKVVMSTIRDISLRKDAENALRQSRCRLRDLQRLAGLGTWGFNVMTEEISWSEETFRLVGRDVRSGPLSFEAYLSTIHPDDSPHLREAVKQSVESGTAFEINLRQGTIGDVEKMLPVNQRAYRPAIARGQPLFDDEQKVIEIYGVLIPIGAATT